VHSIAIDNPHPEVSFATLWKKVWYENYPEPQYVWQSTASNAAFEPKLSLAPLAFGTLKASLYAMIFAVPIALLGATYTAVFMAPALRRKIKPTIELMAALPTVILGFLAGLWLAPLIENQLASLFAMTLILPPGLLLFAFAWSRPALQQRIPWLRGWEPILLLPVMIALVLFALWVAPPLQQLIFGGDLREWLSQEAGVSFDQRNAIVVGVAMGFSVIPIIFSIAEDALYAVPTSLTDGSLALGATRWQSLVRIVLPTASPGIFSGLMIGLGRAVGETMIVLMATGNTPIMNWNLFEGMRTLAANIAIEMPESAIASTHFRVLFLSALVLFVFTFLVNTVAEIIRQRLRERYASF
jgi:phosphate transport system permease protein